MANNRITPFVKRMRTNGGTIYTFSSAVEDIGLNINERNNVVKLSYFALLNIPSIQEPSANVNNTFNAFSAINGAFKYNQGSASIKDGRVIIAESFENYALNLESNLLNRDDYNASLQRTVSERVFWKWLKETGAIRWAKDASGNWVEEEDGTGGYDSVVKYVGQVAAGNVRTDTFGTYNETYVLVPTSHGQTKVFFDQFEDDNYKHGMVIPSSGDGGTNILGREGYTKPHPDGLDYRAQYDFMDSSTSIDDAGGNVFNLAYDSSIGSYSDGWWWSQYPSLISKIGSNLRLYAIDSSSYLDSSIFSVDLRYKDGGNEIEFRRSNVDCISLVWDETELKEKYGLSPSISESDMYNQIAIEESINDNFDFNAVLIYYSIYNSTLDDVLQTNLLGVLFLDAPSGNSANLTTEGILIPSLEKIQSGPVGFGTSYSLRLNIKTDNMLDDTTAVVVDKSTSDQLYAEDWNEVFYNLERSVNILTQQNRTMSYIVDQYNSIQNEHTQILNDIKALEYTVNDISRDIQGDAGTVPLFSDGDDPLVESSIYMRYGRVGVFTNNPHWGLHIDSSVKTLDITIENAIRDVSGNVILGYGSPLQLGSSTGLRDVNIYAGNINPAITVDTSNNVTATGDVSVVGNFQVDGSAKIEYIEATNFSSPNFDFSVTYLVVPGNVGSGLEWDGNYLNVLPNSDVSAAGSTGDIQFNNGGVLNADGSLNWDTTESLLNVAGIINVDSHHNDIESLTLTRNGELLISNDANDNIGLYVSLLEDYNIESGVTDSGQRTGGVFDVYVNDPSFEGTISNQYGIKIRTGHDGITPGGTISNAVGIQIEEYGGGSATVTNSYSIRSTGNDANMEHAGPVQIGNSAVSGINYALKVDGAYGNNILRVQGNGKIAINGTSAPYGVLNIYQTGSGNTDGIFLYNGAGNSCRMYHSASNEFVFYRPSATEAMAIGNTGNIRMPSLSSSSQANVVYYNTATGELTYDTAPTGMSWSGSTGDAIGTYGGANQINAESNLRFVAGTYNTKLGILRVIPTMAVNTYSTGSAELGLINKRSTAATNMPQHHLYSGFAWIDDNSYASIPQSSAVISMKHIYDDGYHGYAHVAVGMEKSGTTVSPRLYFKGNVNIIEETAADGGNWLTAFDNRNDIIPAVGNTYDIGNSSLYFQDLYIAPPSGTQAEILYYNNTTKRVYRGAPAGGVTWSGSTTNAIGTYSGASSITAQPNLTFDGDILTFGSTDSVIDAAGHMIIQSGGSSYDLTLRSNPDGTNSGNVFLYASTPYSGTPGSVYIGGDNGVEYSNYINFYAGNATQERMQINNSGDILVHDGAAVFTAPSAKFNLIRNDNVVGTNTAILGNFALDIRHPSAATGYGQGIKFTVGNSSSYTGTAALYAERTGQNSAGRLNIAVKQTTTSGDTSIPKLVSFDGYNQRTSFFTIGGTEVVRISHTNGRIDSDNDVVAYSTTVSDERLKDNIQELENPLEKILQLRGISYDRKVNGEKHIGFIAQEAEKSIPEVVVETELPLETGDDNELYKTIRYQEIIPYLTEAIKEQQKLIEELRREVEELKKSK